MPSPGTDDTEEQLVRNHILATVLTAGLVAAMPAAAAANGADNDRANDCVFPVPPFQSTGLQVQKVRTPADTGKFSCHGTIDDPSQAPAQALTLEGPCFLPVFFGSRPGAGSATITPSGRINISCHFGPG